MHLTKWTTTTLVLVTEATLAASSALVYLPSFKRHDDLNDIMMKRASELYEGDLERRSPQSGTLSLSNPDVEQNATTLSACSNALSSYTNVSNSAGMAVCYNILDWHASMGGLFQADLRLFQVSPATDDFANIPVSGITVNLAYPNSTQYSTLTNVRRTISSLERRDNGTSQIQQFSLQGSFKMPINVKRLNT